MMYLYFIFFSFSLVGYGFLVSKLLNIKSSSIGIYGILGITFSCIFSFLTSLFFIHSVFFNLFFWIVGLTFVFIFSKKIENLKSEIISFFIVFFILTIFITVEKIMMIFLIIIFHILFFNRIFHPMVLVNLIMVLEVHHQFSF